MTPERKTEMGQRVYWTCAQEEHKHATEAGAAGCIVRLPKQQQPQKKWTAQRLKDLMNMVDSGQSYAAVAKAYGLSYTTVRQAYQNGARRIRLWGQL
jgi:DNA invertase Pin-like site-specific DNA recombinase